ncbi:MAG TPA: extracellular solute-binding protein [Actinomycetota bacterium]|nr:extracellular solute-binding protein [Actinomycetota bacterium]
MSGRAAIAALALVLPALLGACSGGRDALTIYSGRDEALVEPLLERFAEDTGIPIDVRYGDSGDLALLLAEEGDDTPADVFFSQSPGSVGFLASRGLLRRLDGDVAGAVEARWRGRDDLWVGLSARQRVLVYDSESVDEADLPASVFDLTDERYAGKVGIAPSNASFQDFVTAMRQVHGDDAARAWLRAMAANESPTFPDNSSIVAAVGRGEIPFGLVNHYYNYRALEEDPGAPSRNYVFPDRDVGSILLETTASVLASTDKAEEANRFLEFMLSRESQSYFARETFEYPLAAGVEPAPALPPLDVASAPDVPLTTLGDGFRATADMIAESGLEG